MSANMANSAIYPLWVDKWVVSWTQAFAIRICVVAPPGECLQVKTNMMFAGNTVWSVSELIRGVREDSLCKLTLPLPLPWGFLVTSSSTRLTCPCLGSGLILQTFSDFTRMVWIKSRTSLFRSYGVTMYTSQVTWVQVTSWHAMVQ